MKPILPYTTNNMTFVERTLDIGFKQKHYPNVKYVVLYYHYADSYYHDMSFVVVYDYIEKSGKIIVFTGSGEFKYVVSNVTASTVNDGGIQASYDIEVDNFPTHDDFIEDSGVYIYFDYVKFIESSEDGSTDYAHKRWRTISTPNTTITHYAPVEEPITNYQLGKPVFLSGNVYKQQGNEWISSSSNDTTDCICSVKTSGTYKEFVGIVTEIDVENNCITFASHGDFLFSVDDTTQYQVGDVICYDGTVLNEDDAITLKVQQSIVGKVTSKIDETTLALFRS